MGRLLYIIGIGVLALPVWAGENIVLRTGFTLAADRHEVDGGTIRIYSGDGMTEMAMSLVARVETIESPAVEAPVAPVEALTSVASLPEPEAALPAVPELTPRQLAEAAALKYALPAA